MATCMRTHPGFQRGRTLVVAMSGLCAGGLAMGSASPIPSARGSLPVPQAQAADAPFLRFYSGGADTFLRSPKDRWLLEGIHRIERQGIDLPAELREGFEGDPGNAIAVRMLRDLLTTRIWGSLSLTAPQAGGPPQPEGQILLLGNDRRSGDLIEADIKKALELSGAAAAFEPDPGNPGMVASTPMEGAPRAWLGTLTVGGRRATGIGLGRPPGAAAPDFSAFGLKQGVEPQLALELDTGPLQPLLGMAAVMLPQGPDGRTVLEQLGLVSQTPMIIRVAATNDGTEGRIEARLVNGAKAMHPGGDSPPLTLTAADLQWIPADASFMSIGRQDIAAMLGAMIDQYNAQIEAFGEFDDSDFDDQDGMNGDDGMDMNPGAEGEGFIDEMFFQQVGLDLRRDVLAPLGDLMAFYSTERLGGGILGGAYLVTLKDPAAMKTTLSRIAASLAELEEARRVGLAMRPRSHPGCEALYSLSLAGVPIPVQLVIGIGNGALVLGLSPAAVVGAIAQAKASTSIRDHAGFKQMGGVEALGRANGMAWLDTPGLIAGGYGVVLAAANALDSALLPQSGGVTPLQALAPSLADLKAGARPSLLISATDGDDAVWTYRCDGSFTVQLAAVSSLVTGVMPLYGAVAASVVLPALERQREFARANHATVSLKRVHIAILTYAAEHEGRFPETLQELVANGYLAQAPVIARKAPGLTGGCVYRQPGPGEEHDPAVPLVWEGYHFWPPGGIQVCFSDGHVMLVDSESAFKQMIRE